MDLNRMYGKIFLYLNTIALISLLTVSYARELHAPCYLCEFHHMQESSYAKRRISSAETMQGDAPAQSPILKNMRHRSPLKMESQLNPCSVECSCDDNAPDCMDGVDVIKDGCCGCLVCARQQGEDCNKRFKCDVRRFLYCQPIPGSLYGVCRAKRPKTCLVNGKTYRDGEHFKPDCRRLCTCQDGQYSCTSLCPHEDFPPSTQFCEIAVLVDIPGQCCKEWACTKERPDHAFQLKTTTAIAPTNDRECEQKTTSWSSCDVTCGMGIALRVTNDNTDCMPTKQKRLCFLRPCNLQDNHMRGHMCKSTWKSGESSHLEYEGCKSVKKYRPKYCSTCKRNRCCTPDITKTITVEFECSGNTETIMNLMWIKSCACHKQCNFN